MYSKTYRKYREETRGKKGEMENGESRPEVMESS